jgi:predicted membrane protein
MNSFFYQEDIQRLRPFLSVFFIVGTLFSLVFLKMEERRMSYVVLKQTREYKKATEIQKQKEIQLAKLLRPQFIENIAKEKFTLKRATQAQIIHLNPNTTVSYLKTILPLAEKSN